MVKEESEEETKEDSEEQESEEREQELEERIEQAETNINSEQFQEFIEPTTESSAPVLERINTPQEPINLEQEITTTPAQEPINSFTTSDNLDYSTTPETQEQIDYEPPVLRPLRTLDLERRQETLRQDFLDPLAHLRNN